MTAPIPPLPVAALVGIQQAAERAGWDVSREPCPPCDYADNGWCPCECHDTETEERGVSDPKLPIVWRREPSRLPHLNYESDDGRWKILHPKNATSNRWELYDGAADKPWSGDFRSLNAAKSRAALTQRTGR